MAIISPLALARAQDATGAPVSGATLQYFRAGTTTPLAVFSDQAGTISLGASLASDANGYWAVHFLAEDQSYKAIVTVGAVARTYDYVRENTAANGSVVGGYIFGVGLSNNVSDATNDIDIGVGAATDSTGQTLMRLGAGLTKQLDAAWTVGTNAGMRDTGSIADGTWHIHLIQRPDTGVTDVLASLSASAPTMPANYTLRRRIGSILRASGSIRAFRQTGDNFMLLTPVQDVSANNPGASAVLRTLTVPSGIKVQPITYANIYPGGASGSFIFLVVTDPDNTDVTPSGALNTLYATAASLRPNATLINVQTNTSAQVRTRLSGSVASDFLEMHTHGWIDTRGRFA